LQLAVQRLALAPDHHRPQREKRMSLTIRSKMRLKKMMMTMRLILTLMMSATTEM
jgi:hypothetical protein